MRYAYLGVGTATMLVGVYGIVSDLRHNEPGFSGLWVMVALGVVYLGVLNLLNWVYGSSARGLRGAALAGNVAMLAVGWAAGSEPSRLFEWVLTVLVLVGALLSVIPQSLRLSKGATPTTVDSGFVQP